ncbi:hypothetical protein EUTSA_v10023160mg [Eutrema salsugineum]|uniref:Uncharacterized protein n=1 Tax=Eutrema salsugineum TaxID=72664 RepID=V4LK41_EUTSA|nr:hypothetical protein EUTSA_v10023160mg [Eutrema salsugineum]
MRTITYTIKRRSNFIREEIVMLDTDRLNVLVCECATPKTKSSYRGYSKTKSSPKTKSSIILINFRQYPEFGRNCCARAEIFLLLMLDFLARAKTLSLRF